MKYKNYDALTVITATDANELAPQNTASSVEVSNVQARVAITETGMHLKDAFSNDL